MTRKTVQLTRTGRFIIRRVIMACISFYVCVFVVAAIGNAQMEATVQSDITNYIIGAVMARTDFQNAEEIAAYKKELRLYLEKHFNLDKPAVYRIGRRAFQIIRLDLGHSTRISTSYPKRSYEIKDIVLSAAKPTLILFFSSTLLAIGSGIFLGIQMAKKPGGPLDRLGNMLTMLFCGTRVWWVCLFMLLFFVYKIPIFRAGALYSSPAPEHAVLRVMDYIYYLALPLLSIALVKTWYFAFNTRTIVMGPLHEDYIWAARGRGIPEHKVLYGHAFASASPGIITVSTLGIVQALGGDILVEHVLSRPGLGYILWQALQLNEINLITAIFSIIAAIYCISLCVLDIAYHFLDPRIRV